tara:strand:+ start:167 stop:1090 length:924 start_codon:yes stop_codon:yes gene_type:complete
MNFNIRKNIKIFLYLFITLGILLVLKKLNFLDFNALVLSIKKEPEFIFLSALIYALTIILGSLRYFVILKNFKYNLKLNHSLKITSSSIFYGQWFPGSSALIEFFRIFFLKQHIKINIKYSIFSVLYDKIIGLISFIIICIISIFLKYNFYEMLEYYLIIIVFFALIVINKTPILIFKILKINFLKRNFLMISYEMIISLLISLLIITSYYLIAKITNTNLNFIDIAIMMPLIALVGILPLGIGNLGGLQLGTLLIFQFVSENSSEIVSMSLTFAVITIIINSIFGIIFFKSSLNIFKRALVKYEKK